MDRPRNRFLVVAVTHPLDVPAVRPVSRRDVLAESQRRRARQRHVVRVVKDDELAEPEVTGERSCLGLDTLHQIAVAGEHVRMVVEHLVARSVVARSEVRFADRHSDRVRDSLPEGPGRGLDTMGQVRLRMAGREAPPRAKAPQLIERHFFVAGEVHQGIEERRCVAGRKNEAVSIDERRIGRVET